jgi:hypothetical protein
MTGVYSVSLKKIGSLKSDATHIFPLRTQMKRLNFPPSFLSTVEKCFHVEFS